MYRIMSSTAKMVVVSEVNNRVRTIRKTRNARPSQYAIRPGVDTPRSEGDSIRMAILTPSGPILEIAGSNLNRWPG